MNIWHGTAGEYRSIQPKDPETVYVIENADPEAVPLHWAPRPVVIYGELGLEPPREPWWKRLLRKERR